MTFGMRSGRVTDDLVAQQVAADRVAVDRTQAKTPWPTLVRYGAVVLVATAVIVMGVLFALDLVLR